MSTRLVALAVAITFVLGAAIGVASAAPGRGPWGPMRHMDATPMQQMHAGDWESMASMHDAMSTEDMDAMHVQMRNAMPEGMRPLCDEMHVAMPAPADMPAGHAAHH